MECRYYNSSENLLDCIDSGLNPVHSYPQFMAMGKDQRDAIRRALNEDAEKLIQEGDPSDSQLRRLRREIDEVNRLFDEFERLAAEGELAGEVLVEFFYIIAVLYSAA